MASDHIESYEGFKSGGSLQIERRRFGQAHIIGVGGKYYWNFDENIWQTTLFWCNFSRKHGQASGNVF